MMPIADYNKAEESARSRLPNTVIEAFSASLFQSAGYPVRVIEEAELFKYADVMHEMRFEKDYTGLLGGLTRDEFDLLKRLATLVYSFGQVNFRKKFTAKSSLLRSLHLLRQIRLIYGREYKPSVLEIGPGCGYLGAILLLEGYPYMSTDVTQAFYLYQNRLWNSIAPGRVLERVEFPDAPLLPVGGKAWHLPWWDFAGLKASDMPVFDVITCNHAIGEMHPNSLRHALMLARSSQNSPEANNPVFIIDGLYATPLNSLEDILEAFYHFGYMLVHHDKKITVFAPKSKDTSTGALILPRRGIKPSLLLREIVRRCAGLSPSLRQWQWGLQEYSSTSNLVSGKIKAGYDSLRNKELVSIDEVNKFYTGLLGTADHRSIDERFLSGIM